MLQMIFKYKYSYNYKYTCTNTIFIKLYENDVVRHCLLKLFVC